MNEPLCFTFQRDLTESEYQELTSEMTLKALEVIRRFKDRDEQGK